MWPLKTILYFAFFWLACFAALINPIWGVINYIVAYQANPTNTWWGEPLEALGMRFSFLAAAFTLLGLFFGRRNVPSIRPLFSTWELCVFALFGIAVMNVFLGFPFDHRSRVALEKLWKTLLFVLILTRLGAKRENLRLIVWSLVLGSLYLGHEAYSAGPHEYLFGRLNRVGGPDFSTSSGVAAHMSAMLPIIGAALLATPNWWAKGLAAIAGAFTVNAVILCRTRSAFIGLVFGAAAALLMAPRVRRFRIQVLLLAGGVAAFSLTDDYFWSRMKTLLRKETLHTDMAAVSRSEIWMTSLRIIADQPWGIGAGNFARAISKYEPRYAKRSTHNTLVVCFVEYGVHGGTIFLLLFLQSLWFIHRSFRLADRTREPLETRLLAYGFLVACVTYFVTGLGTERFYCESFWWVLALPLCLHRTVLAEAAVQDAEYGIANVEPANRHSEFQIPQTDPWHAAPGVDIGAV